MILSTKKFSNLIEFIIIAIFWKNKIIEIIEPILAIMSPAYGYVTNRNCYTPATFNFTTKIY